jgi:hypothetical protein
MDSLCFLFECLSLSEKRKRSSYKDEDLFYNGPKRIRWITSLYELNAVGLQNRPIGEKIRPEKSKKLPKMDAGVSSLLKGNNGSKVYKDVEEFGRNLPRDKLNNRHRHTTHPEPSNQYLSVRNPNQFKTLPTGNLGKGQQTRQLDGQPVSKKKSLVVNSSDRGQIVNLGSKPKVLTVEDVEHLVKCLNDRFV